jgi:hypothetical protein
MDIRISLYECIQHNPWQTGMQIRAASAKHLHLITLEITVKLPQITHLSVWKLNSIESVTR